MWWRFKVIYNPGRSHEAADAMSRIKPLRPLFITLDETDDDDEREMLEVNLAVLHSAPNDIRETDGVISWNKVFKATQDDPILVRVIEEVERGMPETSYELEKGIYSFWKK